MALDWIKMRKELPHDPAIILVAAKTGLDIDGVLGRVYRLWCWADSHTANGKIDHVSALWVDEFLRAARISDALTDVGWLRIEEDAIVFPKFNRHMSQSAKQRALASERKARSRVTKKRDRCHASVTQKAGPEKRREEKNKNTPLPPFFSDFWDAYPKKVGKRQAAKLWAKISTADVPGLMGALSNYLESDRARGGFLRDPERFLKDDWWREWVVAPSASVVTQGARTLDEMRREGLVT